MELQFRKREIPCLRQIGCETVSREVTQEVRLTDGMPDIGRVISTWGQIILRSKEWRGDTVTATGGVMVWILYAPEDGTDPRCMDAWIPYQLHWEHMDADLEGPLRIRTWLRFSDARTIAARKFMVRMGVCAAAEALSSEEMSVYAPQEMPEDIQLLCRKYPLRLPKAAGEKTFQMDEEISLTGPAPDRIISYTMQPQITDCRVLANKLVFRGVGKLHLIYVCREGRIRTSDYEVPFSQFDELEKTHSPDARADICFGITQLELDMEEGILRLKCGMVAQYLVDDREMVEIVEDAYSPRRMVAIQRESLQLPSILEDRTETVTASQIAHGHIADAVDVDFLPDAPRQLQTADGIELVVPGMFRTLYYGEDGSLQSVNTRWETSVKLPAGEDSRVGMMSMMPGQPQAVQGAEGIDLSASLEIRLRTFAESGLPMVKALEAGQVQEPDPGRPSLILCRPDGDTIWEIAKRCGSSMTAIRQANGLEEDALMGRVLLVPVL